MRIAFSGAQGTGKTTTMRELNAVLGLPVLESPARKILNSMNLSVAEMRRKGMEPEFQRRVAETIAIAHGSTRDFIADRSLFDSYGYDAALGLTNLDYERLMKRYRVRYDIVFFLPIEFPAQPDGVREVNDVERRMVEEEILNALERSKTPHAILRGSLENRVSDALCMISSLVGKKLPQALAAVSA